jgi:hypothetical protein
MKKLLAILILSLPLGSFAASSTIVSFQCKSTEVEGIHKFDAKGVVSIDEYNKVDGYISVQVQKAQAPDSVQVFEEIKINGTRQHFNPGELVPTEFDQLTLFTNETYIKSLNLLLNFKVENASQVFTIDNFLYRSNCYLVDSATNK